MDKKEIKEIIKFINTKYDEDIPGPVKFIVRRKIKKIEGLNIEDIPEAFRKCSVEELLLVLKDAYEKKKLKL